MLIDWQLSNLTFCVAELTKDVSPQERSLLEFWGRPVLLRSGALGGGGAGLVVDGGAESEAASAAVPDGLRLRGRHARPAQHVRGEKVMCLNSSSVTCERLPCF